MDFQSALKEIVLAALPQAVASDDKCEEIVNHLTLNLEMSSLNEIPHVRDTDLQPALTIFQARSFVIALQKDQINGGNEESSPDIQGQAQQNSSDQQLLPSTGRRTRHGEWNFSLNWNDIYNISKSVKLKMQTGRKLTKRQNTELVHRVVLQVRESVPGARRSIFKQIITDLKKKHHGTFSSERIRGKPGLCYRMKNKFDNMRRKKKGRTRAEEEAPAIKPAYGCKKWRLKSIPQGQTQQSLKVTQENLKNHYETVRMRAWDWELIQSGMKTCYGNLRTDINKQALAIENAKKQARSKKTNNDQPLEVPEDIPTTESIRDKWPFLFVPRIMLMHFTILTEVNILEEMSTFYENDMDKVIKYLIATNRSKRRKKTKKEMRNSKMSQGNPEMAAFIILLLSRFCEDSSGIFLIVDEAATEDDLPNLCEIPKTPHLIIAGTSLFNYKTVYFSLDGKVMGMAQDLLKGFAMLFASYFVFNVEYDAMAQVTLEFFQRFVVDISPARGNKRPSKEHGGHHSIYSLHPRVGRLTDQMEEFFAEHDEGSADTEEMENEGL